VQPGDGFEDLVIPTPERVTFQYPIAGIGSRFLAQSIDVLLLVVILTVVGIGGAAFGSVFHAAQLAILIWLLLWFVVIFGYFLVLEAVFGGQTPGKRALRLRVVGDRGEPIHFSQAAIRNLVRIVDFLPFFYGLGLVTLFINGRGKRLGDLAAGTIVVRERERVSLYDLAATPASPQPAPVQPAPSIWSAPSATSGSEAADSPASPPAIPPPAPDADRVRRLEPALRRLVVAYAARRSELPPDRRESLARSAEPALRRALPELTAAGGPLRALDQLAEWEGVTPRRTIPASASWTLALGIASLACAILVVLSPAGVLLGIAAILVARRTLRRIKAQPAALQGAERTRTGRVLGIIGLAGSALFIVIFIAGSIVAR
jgi:uncharacterized RDD family membrane protein YckC